MYITWRPTRGADKSLAWPGKKQATATKLGIFQHTPNEAQYTSKSDALILQAIQKKIRRLSVQPVLCGSNDLCVVRKTATIQFFFSIQGQCSSPTRPDLENRLLGDQDAVSQGRPLSSGMQVPSEPGHCRARTRPLWWTSLGVFPSKCPSIAPAEISNTPRW